MTESDRLQDLFLEELEELTGALAQGVAGLDAQDLSRAALDELFRAAHSLKGAAQVMGAREIADAAHGMESVLSALREGTLAIAEEVVAGLIEAADWLQGAPGAMAAGEALDGRQARRLRKQLVELVGPAQDLGDSPPAPQDKAEPAAGDAQVPGRVPAPRDTDSVRVSAARLDGLLQQTAEVMVARQRLDELRRQLSVATDFFADHDRQWRQLRGTLSEAARHGLVPQETVAAVQRAETSWRLAETAIDPLARQAVGVERDLRQSVVPLAERILELRTVPFAQVCEGFDRLVRDVARAGDKQAVLAVEGYAVEVDRSVALALRDPLIHLIHNAVDHGIESVAARQAAGKPKVGRVTLTAELSGGQIEIAVADDGAGLDSDAVRAAASGAGLHDLEDEADLVEAVFRAGISTAGVVTETSGRGVGLDAVRARIDGVGGSVDLTSERGKGTTVTLVVPITLSVLHAITARVGDQTVMIPSAGIQRVLRVDPNDVRIVAGRPTILFEDRHVPLVDLAQVLGWSTEASRQNEQVPTIMVAAGGLQLGLTVSALLGEGEVTVHGLGQRISEAPATVGAALLPDGGVAVILSAMACGRLAAAQSPVSRGQPVDSAEELAVAPRILLAEDTMTTRVLEQGILEAAGYEVVTAVDGADAWQQLRDRGADLVVSDVNMPRMDGFQLCAAIRRSRRFADLPVVLVTSLADEADRRRGVEAGANAYIVKSGFDRGVLLDTVARLLP